jgi:CubicO group peptidase (beta-lactamase class C family)
MRSLPHRRIFPLAIIEPSAPFRVIGPSPFSRAARIAAGLLLAAQAARGAVDANAAAAIPPPTPVVVKLSADQIAAYRYSLEKSRTDAGLPGVAVALIQPGQTLLLDGLGKRSLAGDAPVTPDTRFALGPATAAVNSLLLARLAAQDVLEPDAPARRCWDEFSLADASATRNVTLRQLLGMTAGLPDRADNLLHDPARTPADLFAVAAEIPLTTQPGRGFAYSDASAALAGYLAVYTSNHHRAPDAGLAAGYAALVQTQVLDPLGMKRATFDPPAADEDQAAGHTRDTSGRWQAARAPPTSGAALRPALGLHASARDVAAWLQVELSGGLGLDGARWLSEDAVQARWRPAANLDDNHGYGLGWAQQHYRGLEIIARLGEQDNQAELVAIIPQYRTALAILTNGGGHETAAYLQNALLNLADLLREAEGSR